MAKEAAAHRYDLAMNGYRLVVDPQCITVMMEGVAVCRLAPCISVEKLVMDAQRGEWQAVEDIDAGDFAFTAEKTRAGWQFIWRGSSSAWEGKEYRLKTDPFGAAFSVQVSGQGHVGQVRYFDGCAGRNSPGGSEYEFCEYYVPTCDTFGKERNHYPASLPYRSFMELMVPYMFCFAFRTAGIPDWLGLGLVAQRGNYNFLKYDYDAVIDGRQATFFLSTDFEGHTKVDAQWETPWIRFFWGKDEFEVVSRYSRYHYESGLCEPADSLRPPRWWLGPLMCGWSEQDAISTPDCPQNMRASEKDYRGIVARLEALSLRPTAIIIDDKWQDAYGSAYPDPKRWRDMRAFVDGLHAKGMRVLLWFKLWGGEGLEEDERMSGEGCRPWNRRDDERYADPSNPKYQRHLREILRVLLSDEAGCMHCDGLKLDYALWMPHGRSAKSYSGQYGVELLKTLFTVIHDTVKSIKPDALINASPCHPYFAGVFDQVRLHDYYGMMRNQNEVMAARQRLYRIAYPELSIDTDGAAFCGHRDTMRYFRFAPELGVPDLYQITDTNGFAMMPEDWEEIRGIWETYARRIDSQYE